MDYASLTYKTNALFVGADIQHRLNNKLELMGSLELEHRVSEKGKDFKAYNRYLGEVKVKSPEVSKTALMMSAATS